MSTRTPASKPRAAAKPSAKPASKAAAKSAAKKLAPAPAVPVAVKAAAATAPAAASKAAAPAKPPKLKAKLVRDSFTMPQADFALITALKVRALGFDRPTKKSELLRAGLQALAGLNSVSLQAALNALAPLKPGRPKKSD